MVVDGPFHIIYWLMLAKCIWERWIMQQSRYNDILCSFSLRLTLLLVSWSNHDCFLLVLFLLCNWPLQIVLRWSLPLLGLLFNPSVHPLYNIFLAIHRPKIYFYGGLWLHMSRYIPSDIQHWEQVVYSFLCLYILFRSVDPFKRFSGKSQMNKITMEWT